MSKYKEYSKIFSIFYDNFHRWFREMAERGELSDKPEEQFHLSSLGIENKNSIVYTDEEINQTAHFAINLVAYISGWSLISIRIIKDRLSFVHETVVNAQAKSLEVSVNSSLVNKFF